MAGAGRGFLASSGVLASRLGSWARYRIDVLLGGRASGPPIFVLGCNRSGTSMLRRVLDSHPNIACPPETKFILSLNALFEHPQSLRGLRSMGFRRPEVVKRLRRFVEGFYRDYARENKKRRWADKTPNYHECLPLLDELFEGTPLYLAIVRHPFDVARSLEGYSPKIASAFPELDGYVDEERPRPGLCAFWNEVNMNILNFAPSVEGRIKAIGYEALTAAPREVLPKVFSFLGEDWDERVLSFNNFAHDRGFEDPKVRRTDRILSNSGKFGAWGRDERLTLATLAADAMTALGYEIDDPARRVGSGEIERLFLSTGGSHEPVMVQ